MREKWTKEDWKRLDEAFDNFKGVCQSEGFDLTQDEYKLWEKIKRTLVNYNEGND